MGLRCVLALRSVVCHGALNTVCISIAEIVDHVRIPASIPAGEYVLGWRWDCEQSAQMVRPLACCLRTPTSVSPRAGRRDDAHLPAVSQPDARELCARCSGPAAVTSRSSAPSAAESRAERGGSENAVQQEEHAFVLPPARSRTTTTVSVAARRRPAWLTLRFLPSGTAAPTRSLGADVRVYRPLSRDLSSTHCAEADGVRGRQGHTFRGGRGRGTGAGVGARPAGAP